MNDSKIPELISEFEEKRISYFMKRADQTMRNSIIFSVSFIISMLINDPLAMTLKSMLINSACFAVLILNLFEYFRAKRDKRRLQAEKVTSRIQTQRFEKHLKS